MNSDQPKLDKWDYIAASASGVLTAASDVLWVSDISLVDAHSFGVEKTEDFVKAVAKSKGYEGNDLLGAIRRLEDRYKIPADSLSNDLGGGTLHHLRDFAHHPSVLGLLCSVLSQFTGYGIGTDSNGKFVIIEIHADALPQGSIPERLYAGIVTWVFHLISDMAGSSSSASKGSEGGGLPGPFMSFLKELSAVPGIRAMLGKNENGNYAFSEACAKLFRGELLGEPNAMPIFDLRTEIGIGYEIVNTKQYLPVLMNELLVRAFYSVRRFVDEMKARQISSISEIVTIDPALYLPWNSVPLKHMLTISSATFSVIDISAAGIKAALHNGNNKVGFAVDFIQGINVFGVGRLTLAVGAEANIGFDKLHEEYLTLATAQLSRIGLTYDEGKDMFLRATSTVGAIAALGTPISFVSAAVFVYKDIAAAVEEYHVAREERLQIEARCKGSIESILAYRDQIEAAVSQYMESNLSVFAGAFDSMDIAIAAGDVDGFLSGNVAIQRQLGKEAPFTSQSEFDDLMKSDEPLKF